MKDGIIKNRKREVLTFKTISTIMKEGGVIAAPTDTVHGLLADAKNKTGISKIFKIKGRDPKKMLPVFVESIASAKKIAHLSAAQTGLLRKIWPGAYTTILTLRPETQIDRRVTARKGKTRTIALRIPNHGILQKILAHHRAPLAQTSANPAGMNPAISTQEVISYFATAKVTPDLILEGKGKPNTIPSTILDLTETPWKIIRTGNISKKHLRILKQYGVQLQ